MLTTLFSRRQLRESTVADIEAMRAQSREQRRARQCMKANRLKALHSFFCYSSWSLARAAYTDAARACREKPAKFRLDDVNEAHTSMTELMADALYDSRLHGLLWRLRCECVPGLNCAHMPAALFVLIVGYLEGYKGYKGVALAPAQLRRIENDVRELEAQGIEPISGGIGFPVPDRDEEYRTALHMKQLMMDLEGGDTP